MGRAARRRDGPEGRRARGRVRDRRPRAASSTTRCTTCRSMPRRSEKSSGRQQREKGYSEHPTRPRSAFGEGGFNGGFSRGPPMGTSSSGIEKRIIISGGENIRRSRWSRRWRVIGRSMECGWSPSPTRSGASAEGVRHPQAGDDGDGGGHHRVLPVNIAHFKCRRPASSATLPKSPRQVQSLCARPGVEEQAQAHH